MFPGLQATFEHLYIAADDKLRQGYITHIIRDI